MMNTLESALKGAIAKLGFSADTISVSVPKEAGRGDCMTSVALALAKATPATPAPEIAQSIVTEMEKNKPAFVDRIEVAGPGFINFYFTKEYFRDTVSEILSRNEKWGTNDLHKGEKILVEHSSPNLFKPFHIGHVMNNAIGESITRLARFSGATVTSIAYPSDVSLGVGKAVYVLVHDGGIEKLDSYADPLEALSYMGDCYVRGTKLFEEDEAAAKEIRMITSELYEKKSDSLAYQVYEKAKNINLEYFKTITSSLGSTFDDFIYESEAGTEGAKIVRDNTPAIFKESEGAFIYEGEQDGLHTRVFINKDGYPTYEAKDIGLLSLKFKKYAPDLSIFITDHEQQDYFKVVIAAAGKINKEWQEKTVHRTHGRMAFKGQKMSSRLGGVPLAQTVVDTLLEEVSERAKRLEKGEEASTIHAIAIASLKFVILRAMAGKNINFDPETSLSFEGDSGPYLQYTAVRASSISEKAEKENIVLSTELPESWNTSELERMLIQFPGIVERSEREWAPHHIVNYLLSLGQTFNSWYAVTKIVDKDDTSSTYKLALTEAFRITMKNGLYLLGIETPERM